MWFSQDSNYEAIHYNHKESLIIVPRNRTAKSHKVGLDRVILFQGLKPPKELPVTHPESPAFALKNRVRPQRKPSLPQVC